MKIKPNNKQQSIFSFPVGQVFRDSAMNYWLVGYDGNKGHKLFTNLENGGAWRVEDFNKDANGVLVRGAFCEEE